MLKTTSVTRLKYLSDQRITSFCETLRYPARPRMHSFLRVSSSCGMHSLSRNATCGWSTRSRIFCQNRNTTIKFKNPMAKAKSLSGTSLQEILGFFAPRKAKRQGQVRAALEQQIGEAKKQDTTQRAHQECGHGCRLQSRGSSQAGVKCFPAAVVVY